MGDACRTANLGRCVNLFRASAEELSSGPSNRRMRACRAGRRPDGQSMLRRRRQIEPSGQPERGLPGRGLAIPARAVAPVLPLTHRTSQYRPQQHGCSQRPKQPSHSFRTETAEHSPDCGCSSPINRLCVAGVESPGQTRTLAFVYASMGCRPDCTEEQPW